MADFIDRIVVFIMLVGPIIGGAICAGASKK